MSEYRLYCMGESGNAYKVALMLELCRLPWEPVWVDFFHGHPGATAEIEKETLRFRNIIENATSRSPRVPLTKEDRVKLIQILDEMKLKKN